jgi:seryl-tRNA synthetase
MSRIPGLPRIARRFCCILTDTMLDIHFIRENLDLVKAGAVKKHIDIDIDRLIAVDDDRKRIRQELDAKRSEQNRRSNEIQIAKGEEREKLIEAMKHLKDGMVEGEEQLKGVMIEWQRLMLAVPNIPDMSVPDGESDLQNLEVRTWGEKPEFSFTPKPHYELMVELGMADLERGAKVAGFRGWFLKDDGARLMWGLRRFVEERFMSRDGFTPLIAPSLVRREPFVGTGYLPQSEEDLYKTQDGEFLAGTAEVATMSYYMDETIDKAALPIKFFAYSPCFRREAGSHGKDEKGVFRVHEFEKYEQVVLCEADHTETVRLHEEITENAEKLLQELGLHYHVVVNCGGDLGLGQVKKYDIEAWMPSENRYRETHSASYFHDFQTRRLNIRYRDTDGTLRYAHSLNNTALAMPRILTQIVENYQQADGSIRVPEALVPYVGKDVISRG